MDEQYEQFIRGKSQLDGDFGFEPAFLPDFLFPFQSSLVTWAVQKGRAAIFADCGLGKTLMELVWAWNVYLETGKPVMIMTPLAVATQFAQEAARFDIEAARSIRGEVAAPIVITNYERLHLFDEGDFGGVICDESSILKSFDGTRRQQITEFMRLKKYRLLGTATAAPNDYTELGTSSEALGYLGYQDMIGRFFTNKQRTGQRMTGRWRPTAGEEWRFRGHAEQHFWRWVSSWARALRRPSDLGFCDEGFNLPELIINQRIVAAETATPGMLFNLPAVNFQEEREERRRTINERCERVADLVNNTGRPFVVWCELNDEGDLLEKLIPNAQQVSGRDDDDKKEEKFEAFSGGRVRGLITKPKIGAWGLNWQHCNHTVLFPTHSYEQYYQSIRRFWRFGQKNTVTVDVVMTDGETRVLENMQRKERQAADMFTSLVAHMNEAKEVERLFTYNKPVQLPNWA